MRALFVFFSSVFLISFCLSSCKTIISNNEKTGISPSTVLLTFDDGPNHRDDTTQRLLDVLKKHQVKAVFCLLGVNVVNNPEIVRRIYDEGHLIANHGYSDKFVYFMKNEEFRENLFLGQRAIAETLGAEINPKLYRPQGGFYTPSQHKMIYEEAYEIVHITIKVLDPFVSSSGKDKLVKRIVKSVTKQNGGILVLHDRRAGPGRSARKLNKKPDGVYNRSWIPETVDEIITALSEKGFVFISNEPWEKKGGSALSH